MKYFSVPADFKVDTLNQFVELNQKYENAQVVEVYGQITDEKIISSGRPVSDIPSVSLESLARYIRECEKRAINFNYTLNSSCLANDEFFNDRRENMIHFLKLLEEIGVKHLTVALPSVMEMVRTHFPDMKIKASAICEIDGVTKADFYRNMGVDKIVIDPDITRNFEKLSNIADAFHGKMEIIVNNVCMKNCPYKKFHYIHDAHDKGEQDINNYYTNRCALQKAEKFQNPIKLNWIRPQDLDYYENVGISYFKVQGRQSLQEGNLMKTLKCYMSGEFDGNLFDLITLFKPYNSFQVYIDNKKLDGFLEPFTSGKLKCSELCDKCNYCYSFAKKSIDMELASETNTKCREFYNQYDCFNQIPKDASQEKTSNIAIDTFDF